MNRTARALAALLLSVVLSSVSAQAQPGRAPKAFKATPAMAREVRGGGLGEPVAIRAGQTVNGTLTRSDSVMEDKTHADVFRYEGRRGERLTITLRSRAFDAFLIVQQPVAEEVLATDDDGGGRTDSRVVVDLLADGPYLVVVNTIRAGETGAYALRVETAPSPATLTASGPGTRRDWAATYPGGGDPRERYAVLVGIEKYPEGASDLDGPADDVRVMRELLVGRYGFDPANILTLRDREGNREQVVNAVLRHLGQAGPDGVAVFYYSGHGTQLDGNYGPSQGADPETDGKDEALVMWGRGDRTAVLLDDELGYLSDRLPAGRALFVIDACHSGTTLRAAPDVTAKAKYLPFSLIRGSTDLPERVLSTPAGEGAASRNLPGSGAGRARQRVLLAASTDQEVSWVAQVPWMNGGNESVFTHYLVQNLNAAETPASFQAMMQQVGRLTTQYTRNRFRKVQTPQLEAPDPGTTLEEFLRKR